MKAKVEKIGDRIWLRTSAPTPGLGMRIHGASWRKMDQCWTFPLRLDVCRMIRDEFGEGLQIKPALTAWAREEATREALLADLGSALDAVPLQRVPQMWPRMAQALAKRPYQSRAVRYVTEGRNVLLADTPGLGKTLEAIAGILESGVEGPYLVVCPVVAGKVWDAEIARWTAGSDFPQETYWAKGGHAKRAETVLDGTFFSNSWVIINTEMLRTITWWICPNAEHGETVARWRACDKSKSAVVDCGHDSGKVRTVHEHVYPELFTQDSGGRRTPMKWGAVVMDESHDVLVRKTSTPTQVRNGARLLAVREDGLRIACSGTPLRGKGHQLWGTLNWLRPKQHPGFWSWANSYYHVSQSSVFGGTTVGELRPDREALLDKSLGGVMLRRTKAEVSPELPPKQYMGSPLDPRDPDSPIAVWLPMEAEQARAYLEMEKNGYADVQGGQLNSVGSLAEITRLKQFSSAYGRMTKKGSFKATLPSNKYSWLEQFLTELGILDGDGTGDSKVVVVSQFTGLLRAFAVELMAKGVEVCGITGAITGRKRDAVVEAFNGTGGPRVLFLQIKAGGVAITLDSADDMVFLDETWVPDHQEQAEDRINNRRPEERVATRRYWYLRSIGTVDEGIAAVNAAADESQKHLLDGRRGVAYSRAVFDYLKGRAA
jgi:hypothetical protein